MSAPIGTRDMVPAGHTIERSTGALSQYEQQRPKLRDVVRLMVGCGDQDPVMRVRIPPDVVRKRKMSSDFYGLLSPHEVGMAGRRWARWRPSERGFESHPTLCESTKWRGSRYANTTWFRAWARW